MFGLFKKKVVEPVIDTFSEHQKELQAQIFDKYPIGREVDYMGVKIRVTKHTHYIKGICNGVFFQPIVYPGIECDYINLNGQIEKVSFTCSEVTTWET